MFCSFFIRKYLWIRELQSGKEGLTLGGILIFGNDQLIHAALPHYRTDAILRREECEEESVKYYRGYIHLSEKDKKNYKRKEKLLNDWYRDKANEKFKDSLDRVYPVTQKYGIKMPKVQIRTMKARWGSCNRENNRILLNVELIKTPKICIDYVVLHELVHFKYRNHDSDFYGFMTSLMPDWRKRKEILDEEVVREL